MIIIKCGADLKFDVSELSPNDIGRIENHCTHTNPEYGKNVGLGLPTKNIPTQYRLYHNDGNVMTIHRGELEWLQEFFNEKKIQFEIQSCFNIPQKVKYDSNIVLRNDQQQIYDAIMKYEYGIYCAPCGSGKTVVGLKIIATLGLRTLIMVHTKDLMQQWQQRINQFFPNIKTIGIVGDQEFDIQPLTVGLMQTLTKRIDDIRDKFDVLLVDESHHVPCDSAHSVVIALPCRYKYGTTATPKRKDGKDFMLTSALGAIRYTLGNDEETLTPDFYIVGTGFQFPFYNQKNNPDPVYHCKNFRIDITEKDKSCHRETNSKCMYIAENGYQYKCKSKFTYDKNHTYLVSMLASSKSRNTTIFKYLCYLHQKQQHILALFDRVASVKQFQQSLANIGISAGILIGGSKKSENQSVIDNFKSEKIRIILGTKVADEGLDIPIIDTVMLCGPCAGHKGLLKQRVGRCVRSCNGKPRCRAIYFWDQVYQYHRKLLVSAYPNAKQINNFTEIQI